MGIFWANCPYTVACNRTKRRKCLEGERVYARLERACSAPVFCFLEPMFIRTIFVQRMLRAYYTLAAFCIQVLTGPAH